MRSLKINSNKFSFKISFLVALSFLALCFLALAGLAISATKLSDLDIKQGTSEFKAPAEALYLPNRQAVKFLNFGYGNMLADVLWIKTVSYFGKQHKSDRSYIWLNHMCNLVFDVNPKMERPYDFCALMLAWEANQPEFAIEIMDRAIAEFPLKWLFPYLRGMFKYLLLKDNKGAAEDFLAASKLPEAHPIVIRLAAKQLANANERDAATEFLLEAIKNATNESEKAVLKDRLNKILNERNENKQTDKLQ